VPLPPEISEDLARRAVDVAVDRYHDPGWTREDALGVIDDLQGTAVVVLGGDVFVGQSWGFVATTESWACDRLPGEAATDYAVRSRGCAREFVTDYAGDHPSDVVFVLYFDDQQGAA
jgi:hypothetical protein